MTRAPVPSPAPRGRSGGTVLVAHPSPDLYGSDRVLLESVDALLAAGHRVVVTVPAAGPLVPLLVERGAQVVLCAAPVLRKDVLRPRGLGRFLAGAVRGAVQGLGLLHRTRPDAVLVNTVTIPLWTLLARVARRPCLVHVHEAEASAAPLVRVLLGAPLLLADRVLVNSRFSLGVLLASAPRLRGRSSVLDNAVPGPPAVVPAREELAAPVRLLYVGRLSPRKGPDAAVEAVHLLLAEGVDVRLDVVGSAYPGYEWFAQRLAERAAAAGPERVVLHGFDADVWPHLERADLVVVPSRTDEPFGNTAVEAVLAARPVVVSDTSGLREAVEGYGCARLVEPGSAEALAAAVRQVLADWRAHRDGALQDAARAARRHSPSAYRSAVAGAVQALLEGAP
ncbi:glycosyltransferase [Quadrisphaera sp. DSM 44207]|uniref:glycosyltransferase n=1 Tax=Quadrisphaera sp. DSM 44207 TaxID=1881057 RepID=UPI000888117A|nr:glycosyltransferase [Quadrisphaera sp. DSM 44207]SDQ68218.1 Glycosyltransferase involved in cell wall bisynthesis [Quadrisphaera sp. DSM 44207]